MHRTCLARLALLPLMVAMSPAAPAAAQCVGHYNRHIIVEAELVFEGTVTAIIAPPQKKGDTRAAYSVAVVRVDKVFKGNVEEATELQLIFQIRTGNPDYDSKPWRNTYQRGETCIHTLNRTRRPLDMDKYAAPPEAAKAEWRDDYRLNDHEQVQSARFRKVAEMWREPEKHVDDPSLRYDAVYFLAVQHRLPEKLLVRLLESDDLDEQFAGVGAAHVVGSRAALVPLVALIERCGWEILSWGPDEKTDEEEQARRIHILQLYEDAKWAIADMPLDGISDAPVLSRLALCGGMDERAAVVLLHTLPARWEVARRITENLHDDPHAETLRVLQALDPRAAYGPLKKAASTAWAKRRVAMRHVVGEYRTLWAMRFTLDHAPTWGESEHRDRFNCFGFTRFSNADFYETLNERDKRRDIQDLLAELVKYHADQLKRAAEELAVAEKKGLNFARLGEHLQRAQQWELFPVGGNAFVTLGKARREELIALLVENADANAVGLDARAAARWIVDLRDRSNELPVGQLWVAPDGTFGFGWMPDRAWGKSEKLRDLLWRFMGGKLAPDNVAP